MPRRVKEDVHDIILEFIRSRPPLHPVCGRFVSLPYYEFFCACHRFEQSKTLPLIIIYFYSRHRVMMAVYHSDIPGSACLRCFVFIQYSHLP